MDTKSHADVVLFGREVSQFVQYIFKSEIGEDLEHPAAHPHQDFQEVPPGKQKTNIYIVILT